MGRARHQRRVSDPSHSGNCIGAKETQIGGQVRIQSLVWPSPEKRSKPRWENKKEFEFESLVEPVGFGTAPKPVSLPPCTLVALTLFRAECGDQVDTEPLLPLSLRSPSCTITMLT